VHPKTVISIQSQVAYGDVGNSAAVFPLQMHGIDVTAVPTTLLSNRPGYPTIRGRVLDAQLVADLLLGIEERGAVDTCSMILSGYLGSPEIAAVVADFVERTKARNPAVRYCCDPVLGDRDRGLFVPADIPPLVRDRLCQPAHHPQSFRVRMAVREEGHDARSSDRSGASSPGGRAIDRRRHQRRTRGHT